MKHLALCALTMVATTLASGACSDDHAASSDVTAADTANILPDSAADGATAAETQVAETVAAETTDDAQPADTAEVCSPPDLPGPGTELVPDALGWNPTRIAVAGTTLFVAHTTAGQSLITGSAIAICSTTTGCTAEAPTLGTLGVDANLVAVAVAGGKVFWTQKAHAVGGTRPDTIMMADLDGGNATERFSELAFGEGGFTRFMVGFDDAIVVGHAMHDVALTDTSVLQRLAVAGGAPSAIAGTSFDQYADPALAAGAGQLAWWYDGLTAPKNDLKVRVLDPATGTVKTTTEVADQRYGNRLAVDATHLVYATETADPSASTEALWVCALPGCGAPKKIENAYALADAALADGKLYAVIGVPRCEGGFEPALARCDADAAIAGTCTPEVLASGLPWANTRRIVVTGDAIYGVSSVGGHVLRVAKP